MKDFGLLVPLACAAGIVFAVVVYPIWLIVHCASSQERTAASKTIWVILMILVWPLVSYVYGLAASGKMLFRWLSGLFLLAAIAAAVNLGTTVNFASKYLSKNVVAAVAGMDKLDTNQIKPEERLSLKRNLNTIQQETFNIFNLKKINKAISLLELYEAFVQDGQLTASEYRDWTENFNSRNTLEQKALERHVASIKGIKFLK